MKVESSFTRKDTRTMNRIPETLTVPEAMQKLHCSKSFLYGLIREGRLRSYVIGNKRLIDADSLARLFR
ncbi:helix-turn-helix domain-containing protein [Bifidobacterium longum]|uniref:helix-turn-helix domain-containing protein n=1 Tax=Bifidobacterium longum TaxID=216816 RepID=UPI003464801E